MAGKSVTIYAYKNVSERESESEDRIIVGTFYTYEDMCNGEATYWQSKNSIIYKAISHITEKGVYLSKPDANNYLGK